MAKLYGISGKATGKKGDTVFSVRNGQQILRQYNPIVSNPNTPAQVETRSKLKLLSQIGAVLSAQIAIARVGAVSPRNTFTSINFPNVEVSGDEARIHMEMIQLTKSAVGFAEVNAVRDGANAINVSCPDGVGGDFTKVAYVLIEIGEDKKIRVLDSTVVNVTDAAPTAPAAMAYTSQAATLLAYGIKENTGRARAAFEDLSGNSTTHIASLVSSRTLTAADVTLSETKGFNIAAL